MQEVPLTQKLAEMSQYLYKKGLTPGKSGNISIRSKEIVAITPTGVSLRDIDPDRVILVDFEGNVLMGGKNPSSEIFLHLGVYKSRDDIHGIVHSHSSYATSFALSGEAIQRLEGFEKNRRPYFKMINYAPPGSQKLAELVAEGLKNEDIVILKGHGVVTAGATIEEAAMLAEFVEETAKIQFLSLVLRKDFKD
jgi:L-fuculose-phosphate aldolase